MICAEMVQCVCMQMRMVVNLGVRVQLALLERIAVSRWMSASQVRASMVNASTNI